MSIPIRVLMVEDSEDDAALIVRELKRSGYDPAVERVDTSDAMNKALVEQTWDIVICDYRMPAFSAPDALMLLKNSGLDLPFIIVSGSAGEDHAVAAMKDGAHDYIMKDNLSRLIPAVERELREVRVRRERDQAEEMIRFLAYHDSLTALPNRTLLRDRLERAILDAQRENRPLAFLLMDLDRFKEINDTLGHHRGDQLLQQVGPRVQNLLRGSDTVARFGGDEFAVLLPHTGAEGAAETAQKILKALQPPFTIDNLPIHVEASIGIALYPEHGTGSENLIQRADVAMYAAKRNGSGYVSYAPEQDQHSPRRLALMGELRQAIEQNQLFLHYQPKISLLTGRIIGVEALVRWQHPEYGFVPPDQFIGPAEQTGLIHPLTQWVLDTALRQCQVWREEGLDIRVAINLSVRNLQDLQLPGQVAERLQNYALSSDRLDLEITESAIMADPTRALQVLTGLDQLGIGLSIDDFGTGYSSLGYLKKLPVDTIKVDKSFVMDMVSDESDTAIVKCAIAFGHNLGLKVVAEGVENRETWNRLAALGCDSAQGYYMSRPIPSAELARWIGESPWGLK
ncbi:MAG: EAL domain-containing protein [Nitrospirae bacterium]|nr:EAL domain-containing protein [Nitrospirota bacterium]